MHLGSIDVIYYGFEFRMKLNLDANSHKTSNKKKENKEICLKISLNLHLFLVIKFVCFVGRKYNELNAKINFESKI